MRDAWEKSQDSRNGKKSRRRRNAATWAAADCLFVFMSLLIAVEFYFDLKVPEGHVVHLWRTTPMIVIFTAVMLFLSGIYRTILTYSIREMVISGAAGSLAGTGTTYLISLIFYLFRDQIGSNIFLMPRPIYFMQWVLATIFVCGSRYMVSWRMRGSREHQGEKRILVIGAGYAGASVIRDIQNGRYNGRAVAVLDDDPDRMHSYLSRVPVVGTTEELEETVQRMKIDSIIIAIATPQGDVSGLIHRAVETQAHVLIYSGLHEEAREIRITDLLGRPEISLNTDGEYFREKRVLITGGGGSIGSELARQVLSFTPSKLILYDISENYMYDLLYELREKYGPLVDNTVVLEVGSVRDGESLQRVMGKWRPQIVIHAAAHKHVPLMEGSPEQAILNNVFGTWKTARAADACGVERFVLISTDKAVNPTNVMGASKRLAEIILASMSKKHMETMAVRFGNVLGSHGSVVPIFERQIKAGGPVTITDPEIIRYFMTIPEAASLVLQAAAIARGGELFILDMGEPVKIKALAETMIRLSGKDVDIVYTGLRPGEKLYEELLLDRENDKATERDRIYVTAQEKYEWSTVQGWMDRLEKALDSHEDIKEVLASILPTYRRS